MSRKNNIQHVGSHWGKGSTDFSWYVTGFVDGEGCFSVSFNKRARFKTGIEVRPSFMVAQNKRSVEILKEIQAYFGCGGLRFVKSDQTYKYEVRKIGDLMRKVIPHFQKFPLKTSKAADFEKFVHICRLVYESKHLNEQYLAEIINLAYEMNGLGKRKYEKEELLRNLMR